VWKLLQFRLCLLSISLFLWTSRVGFIFIPGIDGLQTFGRERPVEKVASIQSLVMSVLAISKMVGDMITSFELILMEQGPFTRIHYGTLFNLNRSTITVIWYRNLNSPCAWVC
jgi:hypothetical protein